MPHPKVEAHSQTSARDAAQEEAIRLQAFLLWEQAGCPQGDGVDFWLKVEQEQEAVEAAREANQESLQQGQKAWGKELIKTQ